MTRSRVSLVVTCYNHGRYLAQALDSARAQSTHFDEIIVVDDGSTDNTRAVAEDYPQVRYLGQANRGLAAARNSGLRAAQDLYLVFLDADDRLCERAVEVGLDGFGRDPSSRWVFGHFRCVAEDGTLQATPAFVPCPANAYAGFLRGNLVGMHSAVMYRRDMLLEAGGFDESLRVCEDYELYLRLARRYSVSSHDAVVAEYRRHSSNLSNDYTLMLRTVLDVLARQKPLVGDDLLLRSALSEGIRNWQRYYGSRIILQALPRLRKRGERRRGLADLATVLLRAPHGLRTAEFKHLVARAFALRATKRP